MRIRTEFKVGDRARVSVYAYDTNVFIRGSKAPTTGVIASILDNARIRVKRDGIKDVSTYSSAFWTHE